MAINRPTRTYIIDWEMPPMRIVDTISQTPVDPDYFEEELERVGNAYNVEWLSHVHPRQVIIEIEGKEYAAKQDNRGDDWKYFYLRNVKKIVHV